jgi:DNA mismatch repair protein MutS2
MIYPQHFEQKTGFDTIRRLLRETCTNPLALELIDQISFTNNFGEIHRALTETEEFRQILLFERGFPNQDSFDLIPELNRLRIEGTYLNTNALFDLKSSLGGIFECLDFFKRSASRKYPLLSARSSLIKPDVTIIRRIDAIMDDKGRIRDTASVRLGEIRRELTMQMAEVGKRVQSILRKAKSSGWSDDGVEPTVRNGRLVIPVGASHKRKLKGLIHDESATGSTVYIEPDEVFETNNAIRELELEERREIIRILIEFASYLRPQLEELLEAYRYMGIIDFLRAKARFAVDTESRMPVLRREPGLDWIEARHPLLYLNHRAQKKSIVPLNLKLDTTERVLVISGPNAGGKSVCLKTIGLIQYMVQCGMLAPIQETSAVGIFDKILIDIGDEQSLENDLSTYSSHLYNMRHFLENADKNSLFLIDEFGVGTEPQAGGAIAESILSRLNLKQAYGVVTTHYANLKLMAEKHPGILNGAMLFDQSKMEPLYILQTGRPGSSFAFEIARKIGFSDDLLAEAAEKTGRTQLDFEEELSKLESEKRELREQSRKFRMADDFLEETINKYDQLRKGLDLKKRDILERAKADARRIVDEANKMVEKTIREIRENQADKEKTKTAREQLQQQTDELLKEIDVAQESEKPKPNAANKPKQPPKGANSAAENEKKLSVHQETPHPVKVITPGPVVPGDQVRLSGQTGIGIVEQIKGKEAVVAFGSIKLKCLYEKLEKATDRDLKNLTGLRPPSMYGKYLDDMQSKLEQYQLTIDLRGKRAEETLTELRRYLDDAVLLDMFEVRILHGKGDGILRHLVREYLAGMSEVKSFKDEALERGGHGITVVKFR